MNDAFRFTGAPSLKPVICCALLVRTPPITRWIYSKKELPCVGRSSEPMQLAEQMPGSVQWFRRTVNSSSKEYRWPFVSRTTRLFCGSVLIYFSTSEVLKPVTRFWSIRLRGCDFDGWMIQVPEMPDYSSLTLRYAWSALSSLWRWSNLLRSRPTCSLVLHDIVGGRSSSLLPGNSFRNIDLLKFLKTFSEASMA